MKIISKILNIYNKVIIKKNIYIYNNKSGKTVSKELNENSEH